jgi:hypothetical protein
MNRLPMPNAEIHCVDWRKYIEFWHIMFPLARTASTTAKPRKQIK